MMETARRASANAALSADAATGARHAQARAEERRGALDNTVTAMRGIGAGALKVAKAISVIRAIAFQTDLLTLNAAVRAVRAVRARGLRDHGGGGSDPRASLPRRSA
jgi:methyl-accepting chemotaxis protein